MRKHYSIASRASSVEDPDTVEFYKVDDNECPLDQCLDCGASHYVLQWHGEHYSRERAWFSVDQKDLLDLEEHR